MQHIIFEIPKITDILKTSSYLALVSIVIWYFFIMKSPIIVILSNNFFTCGTDNKKIMLSVYLHERYNLVIELSTNKIFQLTYQYFFQNLPENVNISCCKLNFSKKIYRNFCRYMSFTKICNILVIHVVLYLCFLNVIP